MPIAPPGFIDHALVVFLLVLLGTTVQGSIGFGFSLVAAPPLMLIQPDLIPGPLLVSGLLLNALVFYRDAGAADWRGLFWLTAGFVPGLHLGGLLMLALPPRETALFFGLLIWLGVWLSSSGSRLTPSAGHLLPAGVLSAIMLISTTIGGPPVVLVYQGVPGPRFRSTLAIFFLAAGTLALISLARIDRFGSRELTDGLWLIPAALAGFHLSGFFTPWLDRGRTRQAVLTFAALSAGAVILQALWSP